MSLLLALSPVPPLTADQVAALDPEASRARENALRADLYRLRAERPGSGVCADAYSRLARECAAMGRPLGALHENSTDEAERFFAKTVQGPDGHVYWTGGKHFRRNDGLTRQPARWWWEHEHDVKLTPYDILEPTCGERACLNPDHRQHVRRSRQIYTEAQMLGGLQVLAMRLGHPPSTHDWERSGRKPTTNVFTNRFGNWENALVAAGFTAYRSLTRIVTRADCIRALQFVHRLTGKWPTREGFESHRDQLTAQGLPRSGTSITTHLGDGSWPEAVRQAKDQSA